MTRRECFQAEADHPGLGEREPDRPQAQALGQSLGLEVIAEGVETVGQRDFLAGHAFQGYLFGARAPWKLCP